MVDELTRVLAENGDMDVSISIAKRATDPADQGYLASEPTVIIVEKYDEGNEVSVRDWPY